MVQDYLSKYPEAVVVKHTAGKDNIRALEEIFGRHGYPRKMITDNGPPWNGNDSHEMSQYLKWAGVQHSPTRSADDPEANGLTERFMQSIGKCWATAYVEGRDPLAAVNAMLKSYRNTEHSVTKRKPAEWLYGRTIRTRLPQLLQTQCEDEETAIAKDRIRQRGAAEKMRHDTKAREEELKEGMQVLLKYKKKKKGMPRYDPNPFTITKLVGRQAVLERGTTSLKRETQKFKRFYPVTPGKSTFGAPDDEWEERQSRNSSPPTEAALANANVNATATELNTIDTVAAVSYTHLTLPTICSV